MIKQLRPTASDPARWAPAEWAEYWPVYDVPVAEGLQGASCSPACKAIATCAACAYQRGWSDAQWRADLLLRHHSEQDLRLITQAEECMQASGLWPWNTSPRGESPSHALPPGSVLHATPAAATGAAPASAVVGEEAP